MRNVLLLLFGVVVGVAIVVGGLVALPLVYGRASGSMLLPAAPAPAPRVAPAPAIAGQAAATPSPVPPTPAAPATSATGTSATTPAPTVTTAPTPSPAATAVVTGGTARLLADEAAIVELYERVSPAVVNITNRRGQPGTTDYSRGAGSGIIFDPKGYVLTNNHVVDDATRLEVTLWDGTSFSGKLLGRDTANDLAVVQIEAPPEKLTVAPLGDSDAIKAGQLAIAIGSPFGLERTITTGIVSATGRARRNEGQRTIANMIQTDAPINPGNSGGPLLNSRGEVIGINTAIESPVRGSVGIGFAVPVNTAKLFLPDMLAGKTIRHPWLGISGLQLTPATAQELGISATEGVYVSEAVANGPAAKGGLKGASGRGGAGEVPKGGDVILSIDGQRITKTDAISSYLDTRRVGDTVKVEILRDGQTRTLDVTLEEWPESTAPRGSQPGQPGFEAPAPTPGA
ncbi:MAG TPA: trypsin-like peptidase domain-containing protein [Chloroflexota bacterium]|jgi:putative serine protease PepD